MWVSCGVRCESHGLAGTSFGAFAHDRGNIRIHSVQDHALVVSVRPLDEAADVSVILHQSQHTINAVIVSLNVASVGLFYWTPDPWVHPILTISDDLKGHENVRTHALVAHTKSIFEGPGPLPDDAVHAAALIFGIVGRERDDRLVGEYCRGLLLLRMNFYHLNFRREAFLCFYRALENFAAQRILGVKKLQNEVKDIQRALRKVIDADELIAEFRNVYVTRSGQVAHSQAGQEDVSVDEVLKAKAFVDLVSHKTFKKTANEMMAKMFDTNRPAAASQRR